VIGQIHLDPGVFLALPHVSNDARPRYVAHLGRLAGRLVSAKQDLQLLLCEDHLREFHIQIRSEPLSKGQGRDVRELLLKYLGARKPSEVAYGESGTNCEMLNRLNTELIPLDGDVVLAWQDSLSSDRLHDGVEGVPGLTSASFALVMEDWLKVRIGDEVRKFRYFRKWHELIGSLEIADRGLLEKLQAQTKPKISWEKTGHGATAWQKRIVETVVSRSKIITASQTTYQNPQGGTIPSTVSPTEKLSQFAFTVTDSPNVLRGVFRTNANSEEESFTAFTHLKRVFSEVVAGG